MQLTLRFFASIRETIGQGSEPWTTTATDVAALRDALIARGDPYAGALARGKSVVIWSGSVCRSTPLRLHLCGSPSSAIVCLVEPV